MCYAATRGAHQHLPDYWRAYRPRNAALHPGVHWFQRRCLAQQQAANALRREARSGQGIKAIGTAEMQGGFLHRQGIHHREDDGRSRLQAMIVTKTWPRKSEARHFKTDHPRMRLQAFDHIAVMLDDIGTIGNHYDDWTLPCTVIH